MATVYEELKAAGVPLDHHESDLYAKKTPTSTSILSRPGTLKYDPFYYEITSQLDGERWYDIPFAYDPFWPAKPDADHDQRNDEAAAKWQAEADKQ